MIEFRCIIYVIKCYEIRRKKRKGARYNSVTTLYDIVYSIKASGNKRKVQDTMLLYHIQHGTTYKIT